MLIDEARIFVASGSGGAGMVSFRREKYVPRGGPSGGGGGRGGDVILRADKSMNTLYAFRRGAHFHAKNGGRGGSGNKSGADADACIVAVPAGTLIRDADTGSLLADLVAHGAEVVVARGGRGGKGNAQFKSSANQAPRLAEKGEPGSERWLTLELKLIADVAIVGLPNAGKSTLLSVLSNAKPRIADYPFTTLEPNLGTVIYDNRDLVFADVPGLIEGAHLGQGLGHTFLRHAQRSRLLLHLLDGAADDPVADYNQIRAELALYDDALAEKPEIVAVNKLDLPETREYIELLQEQLSGRGASEPLAISALTRENVTSLTQRVFYAIAELQDDPAKPSQATEVYELDDDVAFSIERSSAGFTVSGRGIERAAAMTYWDYDEAIVRFQKTLESLGIARALKEAGVQNGDSVFIAGQELEWSD